ncbi:MAG: NADAR family protein [Chlamydiae bacterium]|nr:NADAR family protein [Chlamydiota bacterium]
MLRIYIYTDREKINTYDNIPSMSITNSTLAKNRSYSELLSLEDLQIYDRETKTFERDSNPETLFLSPILDIPLGRCLVFEDQAFRIYSIDDLESFDIESLNKTAALLAKNCGKTFEFEAILPVIEKINKVWTELRMQQDALAVVIDEDQILRFSSRRERVCWLSNFFPTLVPDEEEKKIYPSLEHAYMTIKAKKLGCPADQIEDWVWNYSAKDIKYKANRLFKKAAYKNSTAINDEFRLDLMQRLISAKFSYNPSLKMLLLQTAGFELREHTKDSFWGTNFDKELTDVSNHLGKILMRQRNHFLEENG